MYFPPTPTLVNQQNVAEKEAKEPNVSEMLYTLMNLYDFIDKNFIFEKNNSEMLYKMIEGMVNSLGDKYSYFTRPEDSQRYMEENNGTYVGIGVYLQKANPALKDTSDPTSYMAIISSPFPGGPADRAGIRARDLISHVNGTDISDLNAEDTVRLIKGEEGTPVTLTIHRNGSEFDVTLNRETVNTPITSSAIIENNIGYLRLSSFPKTSEDTIRKDLRNLLEKGAKGIILDLRNNGGGLMDDAVNIANMFLDHGTIVSVHYNESSPLEDQIFSATPYLVVPKNMPVVVLVNQGSASSSEILTSALKENKRALIVGEKTFGKGIIQQVFPFAGGYISVTVGKYNTPSGNNIHDLGIEPDYLVETEEYSDKEMEAYSTFLKDNPKVTKTWIEERPEYSKENINAFYEKYKNSEVPETILKVLIRNEYIYNQEDYNATNAITDTEFDLQLKKAVEILKDLM